MCLLSISRLDTCFLHCCAMLWSMRKSEVEVTMASGWGVSDDPNSIVAVRARLMDGLPEFGEVLRPVLEGTTATKAFVLEPLQYGNISEDFRVVVIADDDSPHYEMTGRFNCLHPVASKHGIYMDIEVFSAEEEERAGGWALLLYPRDASWKQIYGSP